MMGCGSSKASADSIESNGKRSSVHRISKNTLNGNGNNGSRKSNKNSSPKKKSVMEEAQLLPGSVPETEQQSEIMPPPVSFSIPVENDDSSLIRKHPPKRLQKLEDQQIQLSHDHLQEKQSIAEERRQKVIQERIQSSRRSANPVNRRPHQKDSGIPEQIEHEKNFGSPQNSKAESVFDF